MMTLSEKYAGANSKKMNKINKKYGMILKKKLKTIFVF